MPSKAGIVLRWMTFLALDFQRTLPPIIHPIIVGVFGCTGYFQPTMWEPRGLPFGEICASFQGPLLLVMHVSGLHMDLDQLENEATP